MRSVPSGSFEGLSSFEALWSAWQACRRGKRRWPTLAAFDLDADLTLLRLHHALVEGRYAPSPYRIRLVRDPKIRLVAAPAVVDRVVQRALIDRIGPVYERSFIDHSYAVCGGRGPHRAALAFLAGMRRYPLRLHLDIRHYFASIDQGVLLALFGRRLRDRRTLALIEQLLGAGGAVYHHPLARVALGPGRQPAEGRGLPLGGYLSHWSGGFYLDGLDHFIKRELKVAGYLRYMDDFVLFGEREAALRQTTELVAEWLAGQRRLILKDPDARPVSNRRPAVFLGFRLSRAGIGPGPKARARLRQRLRRITGGDGEHLARSLQAYRGMWRALGGH